MIQSPVLKYAPSPCLSPFTLPCSSPPQPLRSDTSTSHYLSSIRKLHNTALESIQFEKSIIMSGIINKVKDALSSDHSSAGTHSTTTGTHPSATTGTHSTGSGLTGTTGSHPSTTTGTHSTGSGLTGGTTTGEPVHNSSLLNKADPRVDTSRLYRDKPKSIFY